VSHGRHVPQRTCIGCGARAAQRDLLRVSTASDGVLQLVRQPRHAGRTAYLHPQAACWEQFAARKGPIRSLRRPVDKPTRLAFVAELKRINQSAMVG
jgi:uncharacterized protein